MKTKASNEAYDRIKPKLSKLQDVVYSIIKNFPNTNIYEIQRLTGLQEKTISGRLTELQDKGLIKVVGKLEGLSTFIVCKPSKLRIRLRKVDKFNSKIKQLEKNYPELLDEYVKNKCC